MVHLDTIREVRHILQEHAVALGLTIPEIRARYPAKQVRRNAIVETLRHLEEDHLVVWHHRRVRWTGPLPEGARPLGVDPARLQRDLALSPQERVQLMAELSNALVRVPRR